MAPAALTPVTALPPLSHFISSPSLHTATLTPLVFRRPTAAPSPRGSRRAVSARRTLRPLNPRCSTEAFSGGDGDGVSRATLLWRAAKLPIYSVALVPLTVGTAAAYHQTGLFFAKRYLILLSASVLVITWLNLSNDVYDFDTGADRNKKESVVNILGRRRKFPLHSVSDICNPLWCPPFRLSYLGLGEPLCFAAFGPFATTSFYFSSSSKNLSNGINSLPLTSMVLASSFLVGLTTTLILFCSHFHQIDEDLTVGKMSPLVRIGTRAGSQVVKYGVISLYILLMAFSLCNVLPLTCLLLAVLTIPMGKLVIDFVEKNHNDKIKIFMAKYYCVRLHAFFGSALAVGLFLARTRIVA
ncbi:2-carboxy-1,4-naphthoquinone phytyltransferase, chloroplastic-like isoform X3 [Zingiber officinale]|uniref:2-carboxy-1,4-naphthoquinone phytyltransferase, chloroplastic-like isoform X3 n=1 Tax=Zingiber officinale TaxID=94328 RepID=UPI001C4D30FB|nr:2-carboxy-1,4-naphthoquinone phytyltransferase, chloroplastic-like isoform X3 [Zingiber officinale]